MITALRRLQTSSAYNKALEWTKLISVIGSTQILVHALGFISGILIIRLLPTEEYGFYTLANTMLGTMTLLSDGGILTGVMSQGGKVWQDKEKLGEVLITGLDIRKKFALVSLVISIPILVYLLFHHGASLLTTILIAASILPAFLSALSDSLLEVVPKLHQDINPLQKNQAVVSIWRLILNGLMLFFFPFTFIALLANGIPRIYGNIQLRKTVDKYIAPHQKQSKEVSKAIINIVKRVLPGVVYYCFSGQITIWLISFFGNSQSIAQLGALSRLSMMLTIFSAVLSTLVIPRFARHAEDKEKLLKRFFQIVGLTIFIALSIIFLCWLFQDPILSVLGKKYSHLGYEFVLSITTSCIIFVWGTIYNLYSCRGWMIHPVVSISSSLLAIVTSLFLFDFSSVTGVLYMSIFIALVELTYHFIYGLYKIIKIG